jgi:tetratricopeptide (TPR) repeat protein
MLLPKGLADKQWLRLLLVGLFVLFLTPILVQSVTANYYYLQLLSGLSAENDWVDYAALDRAIVDDPAAVQYAVYGLLGVRPAVYAAIAPDTVSAVEVLSILSNLNERRQREELAIYYLIMRRVDMADHQGAIADLTMLRASGSLLGLGRVLFASGQTAYAADYLEAALFLRPTSYAILRDLADLYLAEQRYCDLLRVANIGVATYDSGLYYYFQGRAYEGLGDWDKVIKAYELSLDRRPGYAPYERLLSRSIERANRGYSPDSVLNCD